MTAVERPVLDGFAQMLGLDVRRRFQVRTGGGELEDTVPASGESQLGNGVSIGFSASAEITQCFRNSFGGICALEYVFLLAAVPRQCYQ